MAKKRKGREAMRINSIGATDIRRERGEVATENVEVVNDNGTRTLLYNVDTVQGQLKRLAKRNLITAKQLIAGDRFRRDYEAGQAGVKSSLNITEGGGGTPDFTPPLLGGYAASAAIKKLGNLTAITVAVVVEDRTPADWAEAQGFKPKTGIDILHWALDTLVTHYGLDREGPSRVSGHLR